MRDTGWVGGEREIGPWRLTADADSYWQHRPPKARVFLLRGDGETQVVPTVIAPDLAAAKRAAEAALRDLCRQTLAALGDES